jgi:pimeloyl-ACP methyl ester carboxylesterase
MRELYLAELDAWVRWTELPGAGPARVYVHGLGCAGVTDFAHVAAHPDLAGRRSLLVDLLGHGLSDRPGAFTHRMGEHAAVLARILDHAGVAAAEVIGHSMGGAIAVRLAARRPDLVGRLVVAEPNLRPGGGAASSAMAALPEDAFVARGFARLLAGGADRAHAARLRLADPRSVHRCAVALVEGERTAEEELLAALTVPRAFLVGERSLPDPDAALIRTLGIPVAVVPDCGHDMPAENPEGFARTLAGALA